MYGLRADAIVGYTYKVENLCPFCACRTVMAETGPGERFDGWKDVGVPPMSAVDNLREVGLAFGFTDESKYDSDEFPKVIFASQVEDASETCGSCSLSLIED